VEQQQQVDEYSIEEMRDMLLKNLSGERRARLDYFRKTGKVDFPGLQVIKTKKNKRRAHSFEIENTKSSETHELIQRPWWDKTLYIIEIGAVIGLVIIFSYGLLMLRNLNRESASALTQPTLTPTALIMAVVLPSGHTSPNSPGGVQPNEAEIPAHLRPMVQTLADLPIPTPGPEQGIRLQIPAIGVDAPIVQGDGWEQLKKGIGQHIGTPNPGQRGNLVFSAHNDVFGEIFRELDKLKEGDQILVYNNQRAYTYIVRQTQIVEPTQVEVMASTLEPVVTLISCYPYLINNKRIVISAILQE
jgi:sortase A